MTDTIQAVQLTRTFERGGRDVHALRGIDLTIEPGEFIALIGPSGSGKSSLLNLLGGLDRPSGGTLQVGDVPLHQADEETLTGHRRRRVGFIFQSFNLLPRLTAAENVALPLMLAGVNRGVRQERAEAMLARVGLAQRTDHYPTELSGGEQQRVAIARALIHNPTLVLADEPTGNLDSTTGADVMALLQTLNREQGVTLVVVTHDPTVAGYADRVVRLKDGHVEADEINREAPPQRGSGGGSPESGASLPAGRGRLAFADTARAALRNLGRRPVRNFLTAGGVLIGIITLVAMVSFGVGVQAEVRRNFETIGLETIIVVPEFGDVDGFDPFSPPLPETPLTPALLEQIAALPDVAAVTPEISLPSGVELVLVAGSGEDNAFPIRSSFIGERNFSLTNANEALAGITFEEGISDGIVLNQEIADAILDGSGDYQSLIGRELQISAQLPRGESETFPLTVRGVRVGTGGRTVDIGVVQKGEIRSWWFGQPDLLEIEGYDSFTVRAADIGAVAGVEAAIDELGVQTQTLEAILSAANQVLGLLQALLGSVGGLALLVAALGVANTMMMAIYERTREIGVLKALGARAGEIRALFTAEAALIGALGGVGGIILGLLLGRLVDWIAHRYLISEGITGVGQLSIVPPWLAIGALLFAAFIGVAAGIYPAARAARMDPVTALRHE